MGICFSERTDDTVKILREIVETNKQLCTVILELKEQISKNSNDSNDKVYVV